MPTEVSMRTTTLGTTGLDVSVLGLGLAALGRPAYINLGHADDLGASRDVAALERRTHEVLDTMRAAGVTYVDAARSYGSAENFVASYLETRGTEATALTIGSKWGYRYIGDWRLDAPQHEVKDHSVEMLRGQFDESRQVLGERVALYQIHSATVETGVLRNRSVLDELVRLRDAGIHVGLTCTGARQADVIDRALEVRAGGGPVFSVVQATWNLLEKSAGPALERAHELGVGVLVKEGVANGRLSGRQVPTPFAIDHRLLHGVASDLRTTPDALSLAAALAQPWSDVVLSGATRVDHAESNLQALDVEWDPEVERALAGLEESPEQYWHTRAQLPWN